MSLNANAVANWQKGMINADGYNSYLPTVMDFALNDNVVKLLTAPKAWYKAYESIAQDYLFPHPENQLIFPDNHDLDRFFSRLNKNLPHWKFGVALYMTMLGIPQFFYGIEVLMTNEKPGSDE